MSCDVNHLAVENFWRRFHSHHYWPHFINKLIKKKCCCCLSETLRWFLCNSHRFIDGFVCGSHWPHFTHSTPVIYLFHRSKWFAAGNLFAVQYCITCIGSRALRNAKRKRKRLCKHRVHCAEITNEMCSMNDFQCKFHHFRTYFSFGCRRSAVFFPSFVVLVIVEHIPFFHLNGFLPRPSSCNELFNARFRWLLHIDQCLPWILLGSLLVQVFVFSCACYSLDSHRFLPQSVSLVCAFFCFITRTLNHNFMRYFSSDRWFSSAQDGFLLFVRLFSLRSDPFFCSFFSSFFP